ncbi:MAG TPA: hypothetical protein VEH49_00415 [Methylomirabilota bacterium]|nr:hypothetical protein [Methylomirabilota bacterium]
MRRNTILALAAACALAAALLTAGAVRAHEGKKHFMGTVTRIEPKMIAIEGKDAKTVQITLTSATVYVKDKKPAKFQDIALGDRVVVHATPKGTGYEADEVEIGPPMKKAPTSF